MGGRLSAEHRFRAPRDFHPWVVETSLEIVLQVPHG